MNYTDSPDAVVHAGTGNPMHTDAGAVDTVWSAKDANMIIWSLMRVIQSAGVSPAAFDPGTPGTYDKLREAIAAMSVAPAQGTFTPSLAFGGAAVGMTYTQQYGRYWKLGELIHVSILIVLSAKGSSTGAARVTGLPFEAFDVQPLHIVTDVLTGLSGVVRGVTLQAATEMELRQSSATGDGPLLTAAEFTNTSRVHVAGCYRMNA